jgi:hypothetical protein
MHFVVTIRIFGSECLTTNPHRLHIYSLWLPFVDVCLENTVAESLAFINS